MKADRPPRGVSDLREPSKTKPRERERQKKKPVIDDFWDNIEEPNVPVIGVLEAGGKTNILSNNAQNIPN